MSLHFIDGKEVSDAEWIRFCRGVEMEAQFEPMPFGFPPRRIDPGYVQTEWAELPPLGVIV